MSAPAFDQPTNHPPRPEGWQREIYPMPSFPMLAVSDIERSSRWYQETLGFADVFTMRGRDGTPFLAHLRWSKYADLLLTPTRTPIETERGRGVTLCYATQSADEIAERARAAGATVAAGPADTPWNAREVTILDPDGYRLTFTAPQPHVMRAEPGSFDKLVDRIRDSLPAKEDA